MASTTPSTPRGRIGLRAVHALAVPEGQAVLRRILPAVALVRAVAARSRPGSASNGEGA